MIKCNRDCEKCKQLNVKVDDKGYPWGYKCLKYGDSVFLEKFRNTKEFWDNPKEHVQLGKDYIEANAQLNAIVKLEDNWNNNGAKSFSTKLIDKCRNILMQLVREPSVSPTACGSIQFNYEKESGDYLEFEIYEDRIEVFIYTLIDGGKEFSLNGISEIEEIKQIVINFYG